MIILSLTILYIFYIFGCLTQQSISTCGGNGNNGNCVFPFIFGGINFNQCTYFGQNQKWCSITSNYDTDKKFGFCNCPYNQSPFTPSPTNEITGDHERFTYTQGTLNNGVLETIIIKLRFADRQDQGEITIDEQVYQNIINSVAMYYNDSSFGKLTYNFYMIQNNYISNLPSSTVSPTKVFIFEYV